MKKKSKYINRWVKLKPVKWTWYFRPTIMKYIKDCEIHINEILEKRINEKLKTY